MSINLENLESIVVQKINNLSSPSEAQTLSKVLKQLQNGTIYSIGEYADLPSASENLGKLYYVLGEEAFYYAFESSLDQSWVPLTSSYINSLYHIGDLCYMGSSCDTGTTRYSCSWAKSSLSCTNMCHVTHWGQYGGAAITTDNKLFAWGDSAYGKLGSYSCRCKTPICT